MHLPLHLWRGAMWAIILAVLLAGSMPATPVAALSPAKENPLAITLVVRTPDYRLTDTGVGVPGYPHDATPGHPELPIYGTFVELPPTGAWKLAFESVGSQVLSQRVSIPAAPVPVLDFGGPVRWTELPPDQLPTTVPVIDRPDPTVYGLDAFYPAVPVIAGEPVWQGTRRLLPVRVFPFQYNPVTRELRYHPEFDIRVDVIPEPADMTTMAALGGAAPVGTPLAANSLRIRTASAGMHRLTYADLTAAGVPAGTDTATFAMTYLGQPIDIRVLDSNGVLSDGDLVIFYAEAYTGRYMTSNVYFFSYGGAASSDRMIARTVTPSGLEPVRTAITRTLHIESDDAYDSLYPLASDADHFFASPTLYVTAAAPTSSLAYAVTLADPLTTGEFALRGRFYGGTDDLAQNPDQALQVLLNDHLVGTLKWEGQVGYDARAIGSASWLSTTANTVGVRADHALLPSLPSYFASVDWVELDYPALAKAQQDYLAIEGLNLASTGTSVKVEATGFTTGAAVYDVRNPRRPVIIEQTQSIGTPGGYDLHFWDAWPAGSLAPSYELATEAALLVPVAVEVANAPAWNTAANNYDYIAIVHRNLWDASQPLLDFRTRQGLRVAKVDVQHIYDLYSGGRLDPEAIRTFLTYAYFNWNVGGPRPHYVLLVGDGHYDFKDSLKTSQLNLIPPYLLNIDPFIVETAADNRYVSVNGPNDFVPDMALGRIPAQNPAELTAAVDKILRYEDSTRPDYVPDGNWRSMVTFVADQADDPAGDFHAFSENVRLNWLPASYNGRHIYWESDYVQAYPANGMPNMNDAIKAALGDSVMLQWFGHASRVNWGSQQVISNFSIYNMSPTTQWPLTVDYSCWTGYYMNLYNWYEDYHSLSEAFLLSANRGSVASIGPSGKHVGGALLTFNQGLVKVIFQDHVQPLGDAINAAKQYYLANSTGWEDVVDTTVFFGDPAMRLRLPNDPNSVPNAPYVRIASPTSGTIKLDWGHPDTTLTQYQVWRSEAPYFSPVPGEGTQLDSYNFPSGVYGESRPFSYVDNGSCGYFVADGQQLSCKPQAPTVTVTGDVLHNYFWVVRGGNSGGQFADSNHVGEFDYPLVKGN